MSRGPFCFSLFETTRISLGCTKMENFYQEKAYSAPEKKKRKSDFDPSEKYSCYATGNFYTTKRLFKNESLIKIEAYF